MEANNGKNGNNMNAAQKGNIGYQAVPFSMKRRMVSASLDVGRQQNNIQMLMEVDISEPRRIISEYRQKTGEKLSLTAYVVTCLARAVTEHPHLNAFRKGKNLIILEDVTVSVLVERNIDGEIVPENLGIRTAQNKSYRQIHNEIRATQHQDGVGFGGLGGMAWIRYIPGFLLKTFVRVASRSITMMDRYGAVGVTAVGMFASKNEAMWLLPLVGGATVGVAVGGIVQRPCVHDGQIETKEHLCLTVTFNHEIVDGAPATRFLRRFSELLKSGVLLPDDVNVLAVNCAPDQDKKYAVVEANVADILEQ
jgi:pyruvate/2-oxoglutarate dehydrogenase complex dihydrolipoamide acyltransferase (E2) component